MLKLLIVDDEMLIRKGLRKILGRIGTENEVIGEAANGLEALQFIKENSPDILITDVKMPEMDGIELIKQMEISYPDIKKIVLSGFDEFNYVRDTMRRGAIDYLLKPVDEEQLAGLLKKIEKDIHRENEKKAKELNLKVKLNESMPLLKEQFIRELVLEKKYSEKKIKDKLDYYNISIPDGLYYVIILDIDNYGVTYERLGAEEARLETFIVKNIAEESLGEYLSFFSCPINHELVVVASVPADGGKVLKEAINKTFSNLSQYSGVRFTISLGTAVDSMDKLHESYAEASRLLKCRFYNQASSVIAAETKHKGHKALSDKNFTYFSEQFEHLLKPCVELANPEQSRIVISEFCNNAAKHRFEALDVVKCLAETNIKMQLSCHEFGKAVSEQYSSEYSYTKTLELYDTLDEIKKYTLDYYDKVIRMIGEIRKRKDKKLVEVVKDYVLKHYNEDITLNKIAEIVYMNPSYICDLFKNQTGEHFVVFLTRVRIDKAKSLLKDVRIKTYEVGQMVGYEDPTYFSKVFKKVVGVSPSEYRSLVE